MGIKPNFKIASAADDAVNTPGSVIDEQFVRNINSPEKNAKIQEMVDNPEPITPLSKAIMKKGNDIEGKLDKFNIARPSKEELVARKKIVKAPDEWNFFGKPDEESYSILMNSIIVEGLLNPITLWEQKDGTYMILSGHTRESVFDDLYQATHDKKWQRIPAKIYAADALDENDAKRIIITANLAQRAKESPKVRVKSIGELVRLTKESTAWGSGVDPAEAVAEVFNIKRSSVFFYKRLEKLIPPILERYCDGRISRKVADHLSHLNQTLQTHLVNQSYIDEIADAAQAKALASAKSKDDIDQIMSTWKKEEKVPEYRVHLKVNKAKDSSIIPICVNDTHAEDLKRTFISAIENSGFDQDFKNYILAQLR